MGGIDLPIIDLNSPDTISTAHSIRQACIEYGFFYVVNHGVDDELLHKVFEESSNFFSLEEKMKLLRLHHRGYTPLYSETLNPTDDDDDTNNRGDSKESFYIGPLDDSKNQWPSQSLLPGWKSTMEHYYTRLLQAGTTLISFIALALNLDQDYFDKLGALSPPNAFLRLLRYPGELGSSGEEIYGASAHSDYGMITLLATDGVAGLQVCRDKSKQPQVWEDVHHINGAFIVNIGDMMERWMNSLLIWTNCLFRSTLHRVMPTGQERYSMAFFLDPNPDCVVECLKSCTSESSPPRFPPIRSGDYLEERLKLTYAS